MGAGSPPDKRVSMVGLLTSNIGDVVSGEGREYLHQ